MTLGLAAGLAPGPLLTIVISETLKGNRWNGILIALAPLLTDLPIVAISIFGISQFADSQIVLGILSILGAFFLLYVGVSNIRENRPATTSQTGYGVSLKYGVITNLLSPHPYLFWISVGAPTVVKASKTGSGESALFIIGFYLLLVGSKIAVALISEKTKLLVKSTAYIWVIKALGIVMICLAVFLFIDGWHMLKFP